MITSASLALAPAAAAASTMFLGTAFSDCRAIGNGERAGRWAALEATENNGILMTTCLLKL